MHVVIVGCGRVGSGLALSLTAEGHTVAIIDKASGAFRRLPPDWGGTALTGFGFDRETLEEAGIGGAGAFAAVTNGDNSNILSARIARENYEVENVVARIYDPRRASIYRRLGIPTVATVTWTTDQVLRRMFPERSYTEWTSTGGEVSLVERALPAAWVGKRLSELEVPGLIRLVSMTRADQPRLITADAVGQDGDILHVAVDRRALVDLDRRLQSPEAGR
ncbi:MAG TPA: TrkA family potassium uptake protein [Acidimicrobiales bacterium]|nr:TrkA family potassium uptake protein [Acidimicrobiales bacterium]